MALGAADSETLAEDVAGVLGKEMRALGINWNLAPVVDISQNTENPSVGIRSFGANTQRVSALAAAQVRGFQQAGVAATAKHFPGKETNPVTRVALPVIDAPLNACGARSSPFRQSLRRVAAIVVTYTLQRWNWNIHRHYPRIMKDMMRKNRFGMTANCLGAVLDHYRPADQPRWQALSRRDSGVAHSRVPARSPRRASRCSIGASARAQIDAAVAALPPSSSATPSRQDQYRDIAHPPPHCGA
jgi:hypothetical protein